jgi:hypothetical protein
VQTCTAAFDLEATSVPFLLLSPLARVLILHHYRRLDKVERLARLAKERDGSQLCVFPEALYGRPSFRFHTPKSYQRPRPTDLMLPAV